MPRLRPRVITALDAARIRTRAAETGGTVPEGKEDSYLAKLIKYIPAEAIATHQVQASR